MEDTTDLYQKENFINANKKKILNTAAALIGGTGLVWAVNKDQGKGTETINIPPNTLPEPIETKIHLTNGFCITPNDDVKIAHNISSTLSFEEAFNTARSQTGPGGIFVWNDKIYNTYEKEEWKGLSLTQRQEFLKDCGYKVDLKVEILDNENPVKKPEEPIEPIYIETFGPNGQILVNVDINADGIIDYILSTDSSGKHFMVMDSTHDNSLDSIYQYWPDSDDEPVLIDTIRPILLSTNQVTIERENQIEAKILADFELAQAKLQQDEPLDTVVDKTEIDGNTAVEITETIDNSDPDSDYFDNTEDNNYNGKVEEFESSDL